MPVQVPVPYEVQVPVEVPVEVQVPVHIRAPTPPPQIVYVPEVSMSEYICFHCRASNFLIYGEKIKPIQCLYEYLDNNIMIILSDSLFRKLPNII